MNRSIQKTDDFRLLTSFNLPQALSGIGRKDTAISDHTKEIANELNSVMSSGGVTDTVLK